MPTEFRIGPVLLTTPDDYTPRMFVATAPEKSKAFGDPRLPVAAEPKFARNITVAAETVSDGVTAASYAETQKAVMETGLQSFELLGQDTIKIDGQSQPMLTIRSIGPGGRLLEAVTAYIVRGDTAYTLSASDLAGDTFKQTKDEYLSIFESVRFCGDDGLACGMLDDT